MAVLVGGYQGATTCTGAPTDGAKNLMAVFLGRYSGRGAKNLGIYNCRSVRGASTTSVHGEGRAGDHGCPVGSEEWMQPWCDFLVANSAELGIQCVIYNRRIWSCTYPTGWRPYTGLVPHTDHAHVEQLKSSAKSLTVDRILEVLGGNPTTSEEDPFMALSQQQQETLTQDAALARYAIVDLVKPVADTLLTIVQDEDAQTDLLMWAITDPEQGLRQQVARLQATLDARAAAAAGDVSVAELQQIVDRSLAKTNGPLIEKLSGLAESNSAKAAAVSELAAAVAAASEKLAAAAGV